MDIKASLQKAVNDFYITTNTGVSFWAPYAANRNNNQDPNAPRGLGKSSVEEIKLAADYITTIFPNIDVETIKQKLINGTLPEAKYNYKGVDCSGFVYFVLDKVYSECLMKNLMDDLSVPKSDVLNGALKFEEWKAAYVLTPAEAEKLPLDVPLNWVVEKFKRKPVNLCRASGLVSDYSSIPVTAADMKAGDLVDLGGRGDYKSHVAIIYNVENSLVTIAHSTRKDPNSAGGVILEELPYDSDKIDTEKMHSPCDFNGIRRLKSLNNVL